MPELAAASGLHTDEHGPAAHRRDADQRGRSPHRRRRRLRRAVGPAAADVLRSLRSQLGPQAANTVLSRIAGTAPGPVRIRLRRHQCISLGRRAGHPAVRPQGRHAGELSTSAAALGRQDQGGDLQGHAVGPARARRRKPGTTFWFKGGPRPSSRCSSPRWSRNVTTRPMPARPATNTPSGSPICGRCCSRSSTKSSVRQPNPTMCCRTAICGGPKSTSRRCATPSRISRNW